MRERDRRPQQPATISSGQQGRPALPNISANFTQDDLTVRNGKLASGPPPPPPTRTVSRPQAPAPPRPGQRPVQPPPPPPNSAPRPPHRDLPPPPPEHRNHPSPSQGRHGHSSSSEPPTPPTRRESAQQSRGAPPPPPSGGSGGSFEARFADKFRSMQYLPPPEQFHRCQKTYPSASSMPVRHGSQMKRTPAPPPPPGKPPLPPTPRLWAPPSLPVT